MKAHYFHYASAEFLSHSLPKRLSSILGKIIAFFYANGFSKDLDAIKDNLREAMPFPRDERELDRASKKVIQNYGAYLVDVAYARELSSEFIQKNVEIRGLEILSQALSKQKGVIVASGHIGNWELGAMVLAELGFCVNVIALKHQDPRVNNIFLKRRYVHRLKMIFLGASLKEAYKVLGRNEILALNADNLYRGRGIPVRFMNKDVRFPKGISRIGQVTGAPILPVFFLMKGYNQYLVEIQKPLEPKDGENVTQHFALRLEVMIRKYPTQWFVFNRFWESPEWPV